MNRLTHGLLAGFLLAVPLVGCGGSDTGDTGNGTQISVADDQTVTIGTADTVAVGDNTVLRLQSVDDARCPGGVACLRYETSYVNVFLLDAGTDVSVATARIAEDAEETITSPRTGVSYRVQLQAIAPKRPDFDGLPQQDYRVTLRVRRVR